MTGAMKAAGISLLGLCLGAGCGDREYAEDMRKICKAMELSGAKDADPSERMMTMTTWLQSEIKGKKALKLMQSMSSMAPGNRSGKLHSEARKSDLKSCPFADENELLGRGR